MWEDFEIQIQLFKYVLEYSSYKSFLSDFWKFLFFKDFFHVIYFVTFMAIDFSDYLFNVCKVYNDLFYFPILVIFDFFFFAGVFVCLRGELSWFSLKFYNACHACHI